MFVAVAVGSGVLVGVTVGVRVAVAVAVGGMLVPVAVGAGVFVRLGVGVADPPDAGVCVASGVDVLGVGDGDSPAPGDAVGVRAVGEVAGVEVRAAVADAGVLPSDVGDGCGVVSPAPGESPLPPSSKNAPPATASTAAVPPTTARKRRTLIPPAGRAGAGPLAGSPAIAVPQDVQKASPACSDAPHSGQNRGFPAAI